MQSLYHKTDQKSTEIRKGFLEIVISLVVHPSL